jgi:phage gp36-like protein
MMFEPVQGGIRWRVLFFLTQRTDFMTYATESDLEARLTRARLLVIAGLDMDDDGISETPDAARIAEALSDASAEADVLLNARYAMPLPVVPPALKNAVCDIAAYLLCNETTVSDFIKERRDNAVKLLGAVGQSKADLGIPEPQKPSAAGGDGFVQEGRSDFANW